MAKKKVLIHTIVFSPDGVSTAYLYNDIALRFKTEGYEVCVLTTTPHYNIVESEIKKQPLTRKLFGLYYLSDYQGIRVIHIAQKKFASSFLRILGFVYWHILSFFLGISEKDISLILSPSPPLSIGVLNLILGKIKKARVIYNVQEIYPDFLINQGKLKFKPIVNVLKFMERLVYNQSDAVVTIDDIFYKTILPRFKVPQKLSIIPNFVDTTLFRPLETSAISLNEDDFPKDNDCLRLMYAGNIGHAQSWKPLIAIAEAFLHEKVEFWIIGEGVMKPYLEEQIAKLNLRNVHVLPYKSRELMPSLIAYADLHFIFMSPEMEGQGFPSKVYTIMACAKPLLVVSGKDTPIFNFLNPVSCSYLITENTVDSQSEKLKEVIKLLLKDKTELVNLGNRGYKHIENTYSRDVVTMKYVNLSNKLISES